MKALQRLLILVSVLFVACSNRNDNLIALREKSEGIIVSAKPEDISKIESTYGTEAQIIDADIGLYLVQGISQDDVKVLDLSVKTYQNTFIDVPNTKPQPKIVADQNPLEPLLKRAEEQQPEGQKPNETPIRNIQCKVTTENPLAVISVNKNLTRFLKINDSVSISSSKSLSTVIYTYLKTTNELVKNTEVKIREIADKILCAPQDTMGKCLQPNQKASFIQNMLDKEVRNYARENQLHLGRSSVESLWVVEDAAGKTETFTSQNFDYALKRVGSYTIYLLIMDTAEKTCSLDQVTINVTDNPPLAELTNQRSLLKAGAEQYFVQLKKTENIEARKLSTGKNVVVAVIDSGINYNHPALRPNLYMNTREIPDNKFDDDYNGLVDDVMGYDFAHKDNLPFDDDQHGTHVSGIIAATDLGMAPDAKILPIKALPGSTATVLTAMSYAIRMKADVVNMSLRGYASTQEDILMLLMNNPFEQVIQSGIASNTLFVLAAGNESLNNDVQLIWPAKSSQPNAITIAAIDENDQLTKYSNYGLNEVDLASYGGTKVSPIFAANLHVDVGWLVGLSGTSMATPVVSGIAAQIKEILPTATAADVIEILKRSAIPNESLQGKIKYAVHANSLRAVQLALDIKNQRLRLQ